MKRSKTDVPVMEKLATTPAHENEWAAAAPTRCARPGETVSIDTITVLCPQYGSTWEVQDSNGAVYTVQLYADGALASCDCPSYKFLNDDEWDPTCKHITAVWKHSCLFNAQWHRRGAERLRAARDPAGHPASAAPASRAMSGLRRGHDRGADRGLKKTRTSHQARLCWLHRDVAVLAHP